MEEVRPLRILEFTVPLLLPPPHRFVWQCGASAGLGAAPHLLYQATHKGRALLLGGCPPRPPLYVSPPLSPPPPLSCKPCARCARFLGGAPPSTSASGPPPLSLSCMSCAGCACCSSGGFPPSSSPWLRAGLERCPVEVSPYLPRVRVCCMRCGSVGSTPLLPLGRVMG